MIVVLVNGVVRLAAVAVVAWALADVAAPWLARHEVSVLVRPVPHPIVRGPVEWRT